MEPSKCKNCGASDFVRKGDKYVCQYCGTEYPFPAEELAKEKQRTNAGKKSRKTPAKTQNIPVGHSTEKSGVVDASFKKPKKKLSRGSQIAITVIIVVAVVSIISILASSDFEEEADSTTVMIETETVKTTEAAEAPVTEKETNVLSRSKFWQAGTAFYNRRFFDLPAVPDRNIFLMSNADDA